jgi:hypothetical protein
VKKLIVFILKWSALFCVSFLLYLGVVAVIFGVNSKKLPEGKIETSLPLTEPREWDPSSPPSMLDRADFPGLSESRDHRYTGDRYLIFRNYKNYRGHLKMIYNDKNVFSVPANTDEFGRRCNEPECEPQDTNCGQIGMFISSKIFGYGVSDNESVPARVKKEIPSWAVYNYGIFTGHYVQFFLLLKSGELKKHLGDKPTLFVFFWEADGFTRTIPTLESSAVFNRAHFSRNAETGRLEYDGNLAQYYPYRNYLTWLFSSMNFFVDKFGDFSFFSKKEKMAEFVEIQKEIKYEIERQFKGSKYILGTINYGEAALSKELLNEMNKELQFPVIEVDVTDYIKQQQEAGVVVNFLPYDNHPTPVIYEEVARRLKTVLAPHLNSISPSPQCNL